MPSPGARLIPLALKTKPAPRSAPRPQILAVDDAKAVRTLVQKTFAVYACDVNEASNGFNALFQMEKGLPDLILLDVNMPIMGGLEMLTLLKSKPALAAIPVVILASPADHTVSAQLAALGIAGTLMKPFTPAALVEKVLGVLPLKPAGP
ncbi:MAG: response regulator [Verrucomicrobia bacterium]|nr:response regulator [Verrucomicrobiota bacterium]